MTEHRAGDILIGPPSEPLNPFHRAVILLCAHSDTDGSIGLVLNRPMDLTLDRLMEQELPQHIIHVGGPVAQNSIIYLHRLEDHVRDSVHVIEEVFFAGNFDDVIEKLKTDPLTTSSQIRFYAGYSSWGPGQLNDELQKEYWFMSRGHTELVFGYKVETLWETILQEMGGKYAMIANYPHDLRMN